MAGCKNVEKFLLRVNLYLKKNNVNVLLLLKALLILNLNLKYFVKHYIMSDV